MTARTTRNKYLVPLLAAITASVCSGAVYEDYRIGDFRRVVIIGREYLEIDRLQRLELELARDERVFIITAFESKDSADLFFHGRSHAEFSYREWTRWFRENTAQLETFRLTRIFAMTSGTVAELADGTKVSRVVLKGNDPTLIESGNSTCRLLDLSSYRLPRSIRKDGTNPPLFNAFVRCDTLPTGSQGEQIAYEMEQKLRSTNVTTNIRSNSWFIENFRFPLWFPFSRDPAPSSYEEYISEGHLFCGRFESGIECR